MLTLKTSRRDFIKIGTLALGGLSLDRVLAENIKLNNKSVVFLWLSGGPSHIETYNPVPDAPSEFRSVVGATKTNVAGIEIGGVFTEQAKITNKMAFVRSFSHDDSGHSGGTHKVITGYYNRLADNGASPTHPSTGSIISRYRGENHPITGIPTYIRINSSIHGDGAAFLGKPYEPFASEGEGRRNMFLSISEDRFKDRQGLLNKFDNFNKELDKSGTVDGIDAFKQQAYDLILKSAKEAFNIEQESQEVCEAYGDYFLGHNLLLARRLCQAGAGFINVSYGGWDMHTGLAIQWEELPERLDKSVAAFINDIHRLGLEKDILLIITGEFGRTPRINTSFGRDHWPQLSSLTFAGAIKGGQIIGESNNKAEFPKSRIVTPNDVIASVFHFLDVPLGLQYNDQAGRPQYMNEGQVISELF